MPQKSEILKSPVYTIRISLDESDPEIWRTIKIEASSTLRQLHVAIQIAMGWKMCHLHEFVVGNQTFSNVEPLDEWGPNCSDDSKILLSDLLNRKGSKFEYNYDMGDYWMHLCKVEAISEAEPGITYPYCVDGQNACPPEDCGGIGGYYDILQILKHPDHPNYEDYFEWIGGPFDMHKFDPKQCNKDFKKFQKLCKLAARQSE